jgi:outer membrane protein assembly factor BamE (lipoprotein component of BamABCDE complex)
VRRPMMLCRLAAVLLACALAAACSVVEAPRTLRGAQVDPDELKQLVVGTSTKKDVESLIGSPTTKGTFDDRWIYISQTTHTRIGQLPGVDKQDVVVLSFDEGGVLRDMEQRGLKEARSVSMVSRTTPSPGSEASFMQQLLGNVGRFNTGGLGGLGGGPAPGGSGASFGSH